MKMVGERDDGRGRQQWEKTAEVLGRTRIHSGEKLSIEKVQMSVDGAREMGSLHRTALSTSPQGIL